MNNPDDISFQTALDEMKQILFQIENDLINMDQLPAVIQRAQFLNNFCKNKLLDLEKEIKQADFSENES